MIDFETLTIQQDGTDYTLSSVYDIEELLLTIQDCNDKTDYYKGLKKTRIDAINEKLDKIDSKVQVFRQIIYNTMKSVAPDKKTLDFPAIGKVTRKKSKSSWQIENEDDLKNFVKEKGKADDVMRITEAFDRRKLNKYLDVQKQDGITVPGVELVEGDESLSVAFEKPKDHAVPVAALLDIDVLDALEI